MNVILDWLDVILEIAPFTDLASDIYLLILVWPRTRVAVPEDVQDCGTRALWYLALALTVVGTLVDLMPEALLLTEIAMHPRVVLTKKHGGSLKKILRMIFSDGKPIIVFAADPDVTDELLLTVQKSIRRRLSAIAAGLYATDHEEQSYGGQRSRRLPVWRYSGIMGMLVCGEILTAIGASLFLHIKFGLPALISLLASLLALIYSSRRYMIPLENRSLHECPTGPYDPDGGRLVEFLIPGPLTLLRYLLLIPVWPTLLVNMEALPFWPLKDFSFRSLGSSDVRWIWPLDWMGVVPPVWSFEGSGVKLLQGNEAAWLIAPHLLWTVGATIVTAFISICSFCSVYFDGTWTPCSARARWSWGFFFTLQGPTGSQDYVFHGWCARWQGLLGLGLTRAVCTVLWAPLLFIVIVAATLIYFAFFVESSKSRSCLEQELVFVFAHAAWWAIVAVVHKARHRNVFIQEDALPQRRPGR